MDFQTDIARLRVLEAPCGKDRSDEMYLPEVYWSKTFAKLFWNSMSLLYIRACIQVEISC